MPARCVRTAKDYVVIRSQRYERRVTIRGPGFLTNMNLPDCANPLICSVGSGDVRTRSSSSLGRSQDRSGGTTSRMIVGPLTGCSFGLDDRMAACSATGPLILQSRHVESRPRSKPAQYTRRGDGAHPLRRSPRLDPILLPSGETLKETTRLALGAWPPPFLHSPLYMQ